jgi:hypothetical protein
VRDHFRAHPREPLSLPLVLRLERASLSGVQSRDLGLGGACLELGDEALEGVAAAGSSGFSGLEVGTKVTLELATPNRWDPLVLHGRVAWLKVGPASRGARPGPAPRVVLGVAFEHQSPADVSSLFDLLGR